MSRKEAAVFIAIISIGLILRLLAINSHDFWFDEAFTFHVARLSETQTLSAVLADNNPPLYYLLIHFLLKISQNEIALRAPSLIFNLLTIILIPFAFKEIVNRKYALTVSALLAFSPLSIYVSSEARLHSLAMLMATLSIGTFFLMLRKPKAQNIIAFIAVSIIGLYTQYYLALLFLPFTLIVIKKRYSLTPQLWLAICFLLLLLLSPWLAFSAYSSHNACWCPKSALSLPSALISPILGGVGNVTLRFFPNLPTPIFLSFALASIFMSLIFLRGILKTKFTSLYLLPLITLTILGAFLPVFSPKAFSVFSPLYFTILANGLASKNRKQKGLILAPIVLLLISVVQISHPFFKGESLKPVSLQISQNKIPVYHISVLTYYPLSFYSKDHQHFLLTQNPLSESTVNLIGGQKQETSTINTEFWLVDTAKWVDQKERQKSLETISKKFTAKKNYSFENISLTYFQKD